MSFIDRVKLVLFSGILNDINRDQDDLSHIVHDVHQSKKGKVKIQEPMCLCVYVVQKLVRRFPK